MNIGGEDIVIEAPPDVATADVVIRLMRWRWPTAFFQDAEQEGYLPIDSEEVAIQGGLSREFFIFIDRESAEAWHRDGATPENSNSMLHFLVDHLAGNPRSPRHVTLVCDEVTGPIEGLVADLKRSFRGSRRPPKPRVEPLEDHHVHSS